MTVQTINIGNQVNDGLGDDLRSAFQKVNANFTELQAALTVTVTTVGTTGESLFKEQIGSNLRFKSLVGGNQITITSSTDALTFASTHPASFTSITTGSGPVLTANFDLNTNNITLSGGNNLETSVSGTVITIDSKIDLDDALVNMDFGPIAGIFEFNTQLALAAANIDFGTIYSPGIISLDFEEL
jgi:hypothetical protein